MYGHNCHLLKLKYVVVVYVILPDISRHTFVVLYVSYCPLFKTKRLSHWYKLEVYCIHFTGYRKVVYEIVRQCCETNLWHLCSGRFSTWCTCVAHDKTLNVKNKLLDWKTFWLIRRKLALNASFVYIIYSTKYSVAVYHDRGCDVL